MTSPPPPFSRATSHGRGGAGNHGATAPPTPSDLITPNIKTPIYTTGRGGLGNLAKADPENPQQARRSQDVAPAERKEGGAGGGGMGGSFVGRGGAANIVKAGEGAESVERGMGEGKEGKGEGKEKKSWWKGVVAGEKGGSSGA